MRFVCILEFNYVLLPEIQKTKHFSLLIRIKVDILVGLVANSHQVMFRIHFYEPYYIILV
jgi:hypothetical protein